MPTLERTDDVFVLDLGDGENRFHPDWIADVTTLLDAVAETEGPRALVVSATGKIWSNGLDLEWVQANPSEFVSYVEKVHHLLAWALELPVPTVAALQGHTFAAGAMFALALDFRVMREDRGYFCFPEVDIQIPFTPGMNALITARLSKKTAHESMTTGRRYGGPEALAAGIVDEVTSEDKVLDVAVARAAALAGKPARTLGVIKSRLYAPALATLRDVELNATAFG